MKNLKIYKDIFLFLAFWIIILVQNKILFYFILLFLKLTKSLKFEKLITKLKKKKIQKLSIEFLNIKISYLTNLKPLKSRNVKMKL